MFIRPAIRRFLSPVRIWLIKVADGAAASLKPGRPGPGRVLLVRVDAIGDYILWLGPARAMRRLYPEGEYTVTLVANKAWAPLAEKEDCFDRVWPLDRRRFQNDPLYRFFFLYKVRRGGFSVAVQPTYSREFRFGDALVRASAARERIGSEGDLSNITREEKEKSDGWYTRLVPAGKRPMMELERNAEFMRGMGLRDFRAGLPELLPRAAPPVGRGGYYVLFPGAGMDMKKWPLPNFAEVARRMHERTGWTAVLCGGRGEEGLGAALMRMLRVPMVDMTARTSLDEMAALIKGSKMLIANDSCAVHMAAAMSVPAVCMVAGAHYGRFLPYMVEADTAAPLPLTVTREMGCSGCNYRCVHDVGHGEAVPCVSGIGVEDVWEAVESLLGGPPSLNSSARRAD